MPADQGFLHVVWPSPHYVDCQVAVSMKLQQFPQEHRCTSWPHIAVLINAGCGLDVEHGMKPSPNMRNISCYLQVWKVRTGQCLRKYERAHTQGVTAVSFSKDGTHVLSSSYDGLIRVHGIKSGKMLKELRGHTSYVNDAIYSPDGSQVTCRCDY